MSSIGPVVSEEVFENVDQQTRDGQLDQLVAMFFDGVDLKKMLICRAPTYPPKTGATPKKSIAFLKIFFFLFNSVNKLCILIEGRLKRLLLMHSYFIYSICRPPKVIVRRGHKIVLNFLKKKEDLPTYPN